VTGAAPAAARDEFIDLVKDLLAGALEVSARRMFSGSGRRALASSR